jgi:hypothetical protein
VVPKWMPWASSPDMQAPRQVRSPPGLCHFRASFTSAAPSYQPLASAASARDTGCQPVDWKRERKPDGLAARLTLCRRGIILIPWVWWQWR